MCLLHALRYYRRSRGGMPIQSSTGHGVLRTWGLGRTGVSSRAAISPAWRRLVRGTKTVAPSGIGRNSSLFTHFSVQGSHLTAYPRRASDPTQQLGARKQPSLWRADRLLLLRCLVPGNNSTMAPWPHAFGNLPREKKSIVHCPCCLHHKSNKKKTKKKKKEKKKGTNLCNSKEMAHSRSEFVLIRTSFILIAVRSTALCLSAARPIGASAQSTSLKAYPPQCTQSSTIAELAR